MTKAKKKEPARIVAELPSRDVLRRLQKYAAGYGNPAWSWADWVRQTLYHAAGMDGHGREKNNT